MYAIKNKRTHKWVYGTDYRSYPNRQRTSKEKALTYASLEEALIDFEIRGCGKDYVIRQVEIVEVENL